MVYWRDLVCVTKAIGLVNRAFWREQWRYVDQRWSTSAWRLEDIGFKRESTSTNSTTSSSTSTTNGTGVSSSEILLKPLSIIAKEIFKRPSSETPLSPRVIGSENVDYRSDITSERRIAISYDQETSSISPDTKPTSILVRDQPPPIPISNVIDHSTTPVIGDMSFPVTDQVDHRSALKGNENMDRSDFSQEKSKEKFVKIDQKLEKFEKDEREEKFKKKRTIEDAKKIVQKTKGKLQERPTLTAEDALLTPPSAIAGEIASQELSRTSKERRVPSSRIGRAATFANLAVGLAAGTVAEMTRKGLGLSRADDRSGLFDRNPILSEANAERIVNTLCRVRGAALKLGQMLSIQDNTMISPQIQRIFERVRFSADFMPKRQVEKTLRNELGDDWKSKLAVFDERPFAAASIGQVHRATLAKDMSEVAIKIQYPGIARSIDSDINNLISVLTLGNILPRGLYLESFVKVAKVELAQECDYLLEAQSMKRFRTLLNEDKDFYIPDVIDELTTRRVLCTELMNGLAVDKCVHLDENTRDWIGSKLLELCLRELFEFNFMQTDPNWANFFYNMERRQLILLDFGAAREYGKTFVNKYLEIVKASAAQDMDGILRHSKDIGMLTGYESQVMQKAHCDAVLILGEPFRNDEYFDFGNQNTTPRIQRLLPIMIENRLTPPPEEIYSLHRKLSGTFLLCAKLGSRIRCKSLFEKTIDKMNRNKSIAT